MKSGDQERKSIVSSEGERVRGAAEMKSSLSPASSSRAQVPKIKPKRSVSFAQDITGAAAKKSIEDGVHSTASATAAEVSQEPPATSGQEVTVDTTGKPQSTLVYDLKPTPASLVDPGHIKPAERSLNVETAIPASAPEADDSLVSPLQEHAAASSSSPASGIIRHTLQTNFRVLPAAAVGVTASQTHQDAMPPVGMQGLRSHSYRSHQELSPTNGTILLVGEASITRSSAGTAGTALELDTLAENGVASDRVSQGYFSVLLSVLFYRSYVALHSEFVL
jgi:hypothetical protein